MLQHFTGYTFEFYWSVMVRYVFLAFFKYIGHTFASHSVGLVDESLSSYLREMWARGHAI